MWKAHGHVNVTQFGVHYSAAIILHRPAAAATVRPFHALSAQSCSPALPTGLRPAGYSNVANTDFEPAPRSPPQPPFMSTESSVLYAFIKRVNRGFLQGKRETTSVTEICVHHNHSFWKLSINYKQHVNTFNRINTPASGIEPVTPNLPGSRVQTTTYHKAISFKIYLVDKLMCFYFNKSFQS